MRSAVASLCSPAMERTHARQAAQADAACHERRRLTRHVTDWAEFATALGLRDGDVLGITRAAPSAGGGGPDEVVALAAALRSRAVCCQPPTYAGAPGARPERRAWPASCAAPCGVLRCPARRARPPAPYLTSRSSRLQSCCADSSLHTRMDSDQPRSPVRGC